MFRSIDPKVGLILVVGVLIFAGAKKKAPKVKRHLSARKDFFLILPKGYERLPGKNRYAVRWVDGNSDAIVSMAVLPGKIARKWYQGKAYAAAKKVRKGMKPEKKKGLVFSKVYKKTLPNGLKYYFFTVHKKKSKNPVQDLRGFINIGTDLYRADGKVSRRKYGLANVYKILGSIKPVKKPQRRKRAFDPKKKPGLIKSKEEQDQGVPLY